MTNQMDVRHAQAVRKLSRRSFVGGALSAGTVLALAAPGLSFADEGDGSDASSGRVAYESRDQIDPRYTWDLSDLFANDEDFLAALEQAKGYADQFAAYQGTATRSADDLLAFLQLDDSATVDLTKLQVYATCKRDEDTGDSTYLDYASQTDAVVVDVVGAEAWFSSEVLALDPQVLEDFYVACPELEMYRRRLDLIVRARDHTLGSTEEALLAAAGSLTGQPEAVFTAASDADLAFADAVDSQGEAHQVTTGTYPALFMSGDRALRTSAFESLSRGFLQFRTTFAANLQTQARLLKFFADARGYASSLECSLDSNEIPVEVYGNLIDAVHRGIEPMHRYASLRRDLLGLDELLPSDLYAPLVAEMDRGYTYEEACEIVLEALAPLGEEYLQIVRRGFDERWVDVYPTPGKLSGAYSICGPGMHPYVLLNFSGTLEDVFTLAHEMGHAVNAYLSNNAQPACYSGNPIFVAEVASTCNEALLAQHLLAKATDERERAYLLNHHLESFRSTLLRQCMFAEFERDLNEITARGEGVTADALAEDYRRLNEEYYGPALTVDDLISVEWARIPHLYYDFYVYQYATGFAAAIALSQRILAEGEPAVADYLGFLAGGSSKSPIDLLRGAGVDMTTAGPIENALAEFSGLVDEFAAMMGA